MGCSSIPKLKDFNKVNLGMTKQQVFKQLGEPKTVRQVDGRELLEYDAGDSDDPKPRLIAIQDNEVVFSGRPSEYVPPVKPTTGSGGGSAVVNVTSSPVININSPAVAAPIAPAYQPAAQSPQEVANGGVQLEKYCSNEAITTGMGLITGYRKVCWGGGAP